MNNKPDRHVIDLLFVIALFCIFALSAIFLISIGADIYGKTVTHMEQNFNGRTAFAYLTEKVRQSDRQGAVSVGELEGNPAVIITQENETAEYVTYLYEYHGYLKELLVRKDTPLGPEAGQNILAVTDFSISKVNDSLYSFHIAVDEKNSYRLFVSTRSEKTLSFAERNETDE